jgi:hypothetical protein
MNFVELPGLLRNSAKEVFTVFLKNLHGWKNLPCSTGGWLFNSPSSANGVGPAPHRPEVVTLYSGTKRRKTQMTSAKSQPYSTWLVPPLITFVYLPQTRAERSVE